MEKNIVTKLFDTDCDGIARIVSSFMRNMHITGRSPFWFFLSVGLLIFSGSMIIRSLYKRFSEKADMKWFARFFKERRQSCDFLFWFPINSQQVASRVSDYRIADTIKGSMIIRELVDHKVARFPCDASFEMEIDKNAYYFMEALVKEKKEAYKKNDFDIFLFYYKKITFEKIIQHSLNNPIL